MGQKLLFMAPSLTPLHSSELPPITCVPSKGGRGTVLNGVLGWSGLTSGEKISWQRTRATNPWPPIIVKFTWVNTWVTWVYRTPREFWHAWGNNGDAQFTKTKKTMVRLSISAKWLAAVPCQPAGRGRRDMVMLGEFDTLLEAWQQPADLPSIPQRAFHVLSPGHLRWPKKKGHQAATFEWHVNYFGQSQPWFTVPI